MLTQVARTAQVGTHAKVNAERNTRTRALTPAPKGGDIASQGAKRMPREATAQIRILDLTALQKDA